MILLDFEDLFSVPLDLDIKNILEEISEGVQGINSRLLTCELFWSNMTPDDKSSVDDCLEVTKQSMIELDSMVPDFFAERRVLVFKNRLILLKLLQAGEGFLGTAFDQLLDINLKEAENIVSQQNLAVVSMLQGKMDETNFLLKRAGSANAVVLRLS